MEGFLPKIVRYAPLRFADIVPPMLSRGTIKCMFILLFSRSRYHPHPRHHKHVHFPPHRGGGGRLFGLSLTVSPLTSNPNTQPPLALGIPSIVHTVLQGYSVSKKGGRLIVAPTEMVVHLLLCPIGGSDVGHIKTYPHTAPKQKVVTPSYVATTLKFVVKLYRLCFCYQVGILINIHTCEVVQ